MYIKEIGNHAFKFADKIFVVGEKCDIIDNNTENDVILVFLQEL